MSSYSIDPSLYPDPSITSALGSQPLQAHALAADDASINGDVPERETIVNEVLKKKRKAREQKACYPCRQRKVKCDLSRPCQTCRDRDHPELCNYNPPNKRQAIDGAGRGADVDSGSTVVVGRYDFDMLLKKLDRLESSMLELRQELSSHKNAPTVDPALSATSTGNHHQTSSLRSHRELHGLHKANPEGLTEHFGAGSIPVMLEALRQPEDGNAQQQLRAQLDTSLMPLFGLDESATYPFIDLWGLPHGTPARINELAKVIPDDAQALSLLRSYRSTAYIIFPGVADIEAFDQEFTGFLVDRAAQIDAPDTTKERLIFGKTYHWLGLFFAVLASGAQASDMARKQRILTSQVYVCCAMEALRLANFLSRASIESIQALLVIGNVLSNNMSAGTAWSLLGLTIRLAQGAGLHQPCVPSTPLAMSSARSRIWWAIVWQDSLLSLVYDRAGSEVLVKPNSMHMPTPELGKATPFQISMYKLAKITLDIVHERDALYRASDEAVKSNMESYHKHILGIYRQSSDRLQDIGRCQTAQEKLEYWVLRLHISYSLAELCRPALAPKRNILSHKELCIENLVDTIEAFIGLNATSAFARQSWAAMHRALSAALLLSIVGELGGRNERAIALTVKFINIMHSITSGVDPLEIAGPIRRGVIALQRLRLPGASYSEAAMLQDPSSSGLAQSVDSTSSQGFSSSAASQAHEISPHSMVDSILWGSSGPAAYV